VQQWVARTISRTASFCLRSDVNARKAFCRFEGRGAASGAEGAACYRGFVFAVWSGIYLSTYPDIWDAFIGDRVIDPKVHFIEEGYFEGRFNLKPDVDEEFYREIYPTSPRPLHRARLSPYWTTTCGLVLLRGVSLMRSACRRPKVSFNEGSLRCWSAMRLPKNCL
jgi:hypothetical protein